MNKIVIFNGFEGAINFEFKVGDIHTIHRHGYELVVGCVVWRGRVVHVELVGEEWWGRTT